MSERTFQELAEDWYTLTFMGPVDRQSTLQAVGNLMIIAEKAQNDDRGIRFILNSPGGSIMDGLMIFDTLLGIREAGIPVETGCYGIAASMGGVLLQAGDHRWMGRNAWLMIHNAAFGVQGKTYMVEDELELSERLEEQIKEIYEVRSGGRLTGAKIEEEWYRKDWWLSAPEALKLGAIDEIRAGLPGQP